MRAIDLKSRKLNEKLENWVGDFGAAALRQMGNRLKGDPEGEMTVAQKMGKTQFLNDFIAKAYATLNSEIQSGRVDPSMANQPAAGASPAEPPRTEPSAATTPSTSGTGVTAPAAPAKTSSGAAASQAAGQRQTTQNINNYVQGLAKSLNAEPDKGKKMALAKELVNYMADRKDYPEWQNALGTAQQIIKRGIADPNFANSAINRLRSGQMMESWQIYWINKLLESIGFTFSDLGLTLLKENKLNGKFILAETKYYKLNNIFESMLNEAESISQFFKRWLPNYMGGVKMTDTHTMNLIQKIQDTWKTDKGKAALTQLANAAYAASYSPGYGDQDSQTQGQQPAAGTQPSAQAGAQAGSQGTAPAAPKSNTDTIINGIQSSLAKLKGIDPALYSQIIKKIGAGESLQSLPGKVSESKRKVTK